MKNILSILLVLVSTLLIGQEQVVPLTELGTFDEEQNVIYYYKDINNDLTKFLGTWKHQDTNSELIVVFFLDIHSENGGTYSDDIYAKFKYTENGTVIYNTLLDNSESNKLKISGASIFSDSLNEISLYYNEPTNISYQGAVIPSLNLEYLSCSLPNCNPQLKWDIFWTKNKDSDIWPFKIPAHLTLIKQ